MKEIKTEIENRLMIENNLYLSMKEPMRVISRGWDDLVTGAALDMLESDFG